MAEQWETRMASLEAAFHALRETFDKHVQNESSALGRLRATIEAEQVSRDKAHDAEMRLMRWAIGISAGMTFVSLAGLVTLAVALALGGR